MDYAILEMTGNVVTEPRVEGDGTTLRTKFRVVANFGGTPENGWEHTREYAVDVICWRKLAQSAANLRVGDPIVLRGKMSHSSYEVDGRRRYRSECEATALGPNLAAGTAKFNRWPKGEGYQGRPTAADEMAESPDSGEATMSDSGGGAGSVPFATPDNCDTTVVDPWRGQAGSGGSDSASSDAFQPVAAGAEPPF